MVGCFGAEPPEDDVAISADALLSPDSGGRESRNIEFEYIKFEVQKLPQLRDE